MKAETYNKLMIQRMLSVIMIALGFTLMVLMIVVEDEPGGIPVLMIITGTIWFFITQSRIKSNQTKTH